MAIQDRQRDAQAQRRFRFFFWNDMHIRQPRLLAEFGSFPGANEKAAWAVECARGLREMSPPDFILSGGDIINGEIPAFDDDFQYLKELIMDRIGVSLLPCLGNHENRQGEGDPQSNAAFDRFFGPRWHNYVFTRGGIGFIVLDTSGAHRPGDAVTEAREAFLERAFRKLGGRPVILVTHFPLVPMREQAVLEKSFGYPTWRVVAPGVLDIVRANASRVIAVLCGHLHLTAARADGGIHHILPAGTAGYPADFASIDVYEERIDVTMHAVPQDLLDRSGNIHGKPRHTLDYTDAGHPTPELYLWGNPEEREFSLRLAGEKRPLPDDRAGLTIHLETAPDRWESLQILA